MASESQIVVVPPSAALADAFAAAPSGPFGVLLLGPASGLDRAVRDAWYAHRGQAAVLVGIAVVSTEPTIVAEAVDLAGRVPVPLTVLPDEITARGWLAGQLAIGPAGIRPSGGSRTVGLTPAIHDYVVAHASGAGDEVAAELAELTVERFGGLSGMNIGEDEGRLLALLVELIGAKVAVEVGTFTGMSALWIARALPADGRLICFDITDRYLPTARQAWQRAGVDERIEVRIGPAAERLNELAEEPSIDFAFIDADKSGYLGYFEQLLARLRPGGLIAVDNVLWSGSVADPRVDDRDTRALRSFNDVVAARDDCQAVMLTIGDGLTLIRRRT